MAQSKADLDAARAELARVNDELGFRRSPQVAPAPQPRGSENGREEIATSPEVAPEPPTVDPGPPRFIGVDLEHSLIGLAGGAIIPLAPAASGQIVDILLGELQQHLSRTLGAVAESHKRPVDPNQMKIEFPDGPRDPA
jgi:hypothetical protein